jgi:hypothetical protein
MKYDVIVIGAGAAGLMCGITAGRRGRSVLILDHAVKTGSKIRVSGGGRCNFTNVHVSGENYLSHNPHFCRSALARFTSSDFISMLRKHNIRYQEKEHGRLFCTGNSMDIVNMLNKECAEAGAKVLLNKSVEKIRKDNIFTIHTGQDNLQSDSLVIATGGLSYPPLGASDLGYRTARQFEISVTELKPGLVPFTFNRTDVKVFSQLSGISIDAVVSCNRMKFREHVLFTHRGLSGPGILQISLYWNRGDAINVDLLPDQDVLDLLIAGRQSKVELHNLMSGLFPKRFSRAWCDLFAQSRPINQYSLKELKKIAHDISNWEIRPSGTEGYEKAEVTVGGIDPDELSSKTMETKKIPGLFFIGEVIDVTGQLGGYNLQWAWSSGFAAGLYV